MQSFKMKREDNLSAHTMSLGPLHNRFVVKQPVTVFVVKFDGTTRVFETFLDETVAELKQRIYNKEGIFPAQQSLSYAAKQLEDARILLDYGIRDNCTIFLLDRLLGGGRGITPIKFVNLASQDGPKVIPWSKSKGNPWRTATNGLNLEGICTNKFCKAFKKQVVVKYGKRNFNLLWDRWECKCPMCFKFVDPITCAFSNTFWRFEGAQITDVNEKPLKVSCDWTHAGDAYHLFDHDECGMVDWGELNIYVR